jgi:hypothetical protein
MHGCTNDVHIMLRSIYVYVEDFHGITTIVLICGPICGLFLVI